MDCSERIYAAGVVPVVVLEDPGDAVPTARALLDGGIPVMEITFRTAAAAASIRAVAEACPEMLVGAGTVLSPEQCRCAADAGAEFIVSPGFYLPVVQWCLDKGIMVLPGCVTPSEIMAAWQLGLKLLKFFPADVYGGLHAMRSLTGPFGGVRFIPTGGVNVGNLREYLHAACVHAAGGSWVCPKEDIRSGRFQQITARCAEAQAIVREVRKCES